MVVRVGDTRLVGLDVARCLALLGMVATHILDPRGADGDLGLGQWLAGGRASALFAVLAGVSLALMTGRRTPVHGRERLARSGGLAVRALLVAALGLVLGELESGLAVILTYYGVLFLVGLLFVGLRARPLFVLAAVWLAVAPIASQLLRPHLPLRGYDSPTFGQLQDPGSLLSELVFTGYYPVLPWVAYLLLGLGLGRLDLAARGVQVRIAVTGLAMAGGASLVSAALTARADVMGALLANPPAPGQTGQGLLDEISTGTGGTTPTGGAWQWLLVDAPHSGTPFDLAQTMGSAMLAIGLCLLVVGALGHTARIAAAVFFGAGTMTLTLYSLHVALRTPTIWPSDEAEDYVWHVLVLLAIGAVFVAAGRRGPFERVVGACSDTVARSLGSTRR